MDVNVDRVIDTYIKAWVTQDPDLITTIFTDDAIYHERVLAEPIRGRAGIRNYWEAKVVGGQANIVVELRAVYRDSDNVIAEWDATFDDTVQCHRKHMREVAILQFAGDRITHLREYWASERLDP